VTSFLVWLRDRGVKRITVYGLANACGSYSVRDMRKLLGFEGIQEDPYDTTVSLDEVIAKFGLDKP